MTSLPTGIYRAKGTVCLDVGTNDFGIFHLTGRRSWLRLRELENGETVNTELVFIGSRGAATTESIRAHFEQALEDVRRDSDDSCIVSDLRGFNVVFA